VVDNDEWRITNAEAGTSRAAAGVPDAALSKPAESGLADICWMMSGASWQARSALVASAGFKKIAAANRLVARS
jgi:hypothetical protein